MLDINNISNNDCRDGYKEVYDMMFNTYKKSHKKDKTDECGSIISDRTLVEELDASLSGRKRERKRNAILFDAQMPDVYSSLNKINNFNSQKKPNLSNNNNNNRNNNNRINNSNNNNNNKKIETELCNKNKIIDFDDLSSALDEELNKLSNLLANRKSKERLIEDNEDCNDNGIIYIPKRIRSGLCLSPLNTKIKVNVEPTFKKTRSEGLNIDQKLRKQRMHELLKERPKMTKDEVKKPIPKVENDDALSQITDDDSTLPRSQKHKSTRSSKSDKSFIPQVPPRGISKFHLVNKVKRNNKIEDNLNKKTIPKPKKISEKKSNCFSTLLSTNENIKSLSLPKSVKSEEDLNAYMKRKYRESKIKILYRNDYYMQELDDKDYEEYDKALFDEQLFINVGNNETDCSDTLVNESSSPSLSGIFDLTSSFPKDDATVNLIAQGYQQILEKNERNLKEASIIGEQKKKYHHYAAVNDINDNDELAPARSVSYSSIQSIAKSKLNIYPRNRSLSTSNLKSSNSDNTNASDAGSLKTRSKKKKNHQSTISTKSSPTSTPESACAKLSDYYREYNTNDKWTNRNRNYSHQNPSHNDYQKPTFLIEEKNNSEISSITSSCYLSSLSSNSSSITRVPSDKKPYNYNYNTAVSYNYPYSNCADALAYY